MNDLEIKRGRMRERPVWDKDVRWASAVFIEANTTSFFQLWCQTGTTADFHKTVATADFHKTVAETIVTWSLSHLLNDTLEHDGLAAPNDTLEHDGLAAPNEEDKEDKH